MFRKVISLGLVSILVITIKVNASMALEEDIYPLGEVYVIRDTSILSQDNEEVGLLVKGQKVNIEYQKQDYGILDDNSKCKLGSVSKIEPINISIDYDGMESENYLGYTNEIVGKLPNKLIDALSESGTKIVISDYDIGKDGYYNEGTETPDWSAVTVTWSDGHSNIYVEAGKRSIQQSMIHEIGHSVDYLLGEVSESEEFKNIYYDELKVMASAYYRGSEKEYFAEAFSYYYNFPEKRNLMPLTFEFIDDLVSEYK